MTTDPQPHVAPGGAAPNPFAGIPVADYVRDGAALLLLLLSLAMPWQGGKDATDVIAVVLLTLLSVLSLGVTYLGRARVFGPGVTGAQVALIRAAANAPYAILVIVYVIMDIAKDDSRGIGAAAAFGLAGAALAGMPRTFESDASPLGNLQRVVMRGATVGFAGLWTLFSLIALFFYFKEDHDYWPGALVLSGVVILLVFIVGFGLLAFGLLKASEVGRIVAVAAGSILLGTIIVDWFSDWDISNNGVEWMRHGGLPALGLLTLGVLASSHVVKATSNAVDAAQKWVSAAVVLLAVGAALALVKIITTVLFLLADLGYPGGKSAALIVVSLLMVAVSGGAAFLARTAYGKQKLLVLVGTGFVLILGIVAVVIQNSIDSAIRIDIAHAFGIPIAVVIMLLAPKSVRTAFGGIPLPAAVSATAAPAAAAAAPPAPPAPTAAPAAAAPPPPAPAAPAAPAHPRAAEAADPSTSAAALYEIATTIPELRATVAANPSAYPDLLDWLGKLGDPEVNAAIAARS